MNTSKETYRFKVSHWSNTTILSYCKLQSSNETQYFHSLKLNSNRPSIYRTIPTKIILKFRIYQFYYNTVIHKWNSWSYILCCLNKVIDLIKDLHFVTLNYSITILNSRREVPIHELYLEKTVAHISSIKFRDTCCSNWY